LREQQLVDKIKAAIAHSANHSISFAKYMHYALNAPGLGYYSSADTGAQKIGPMGDFITAPQLGNLFAKCLATQIHEVLIALDGGIILEIGAGTGKLANDLLIELSNLGSPLHGYHILEVSPYFKASQQRALAANSYSESITWISSLPDKPIKGIILANEVLDTLPVHIFELTPQGPQELGVTTDDNGFNWIARTPGKNLLEQINALNLSQDVFQENYRSEINLLLLNWMDNFVNILSTGLILFIDYGFPKLEYYHPQRSLGTLMCHYQHRSHSDPFLCPGLQDITAHVNFSYVYDCAKKLQLLPLGFSQLASFLLDCGLLEYFKRLSFTDPMQKAKAMHEVNVLTSPAEMGELFKVIAFGKDVEMALRGFTTHNKLYNLFMH
jgi:SAM-dependent MidA family methyltransferase